MGLWIAFALVTFAIATVLSLVLLGVLWLLTDQPPVDAWDRPGIGEDRR